MSNDCNVVNITLEQEIAQTVESVVYKPCVYNEKTDSLCSVIFDPSSNVTYEYTAALPEAEEEIEIVYVENMNEDVKVEVDVCSENYQGDTSEACSQEVAPAELKDHQKVPRKGLHTCKICSKTFSQVLDNFKYCFLNNGTLAPVYSSILSFLMAIFLSKLIMSTIIVH